MSILHIKAVVYANTSYHNSDICQYYISLCWYMQLPYINMVVNAITIHQYGGICKNHTPLYW